MNINVEGIKQTFDEQLVPAFKAALGEIKCSADIVSDIWSPDAEELASEDETFEVRLGGTSDRFDWSIGATQVELSSKAHGGFYDQYFGDMFGAKWGPRATHAAQKHAT